MKPLSKIYTHSTYPLTLLYKDSADAAIDITGASAKLVLRRSAYTAPVLEKDAVITGPLGKIDFTINPSDTTDTLDERDSETFQVGAKLILSTGEEVTLLQTSVEMHRNIVT